MNKLFDFWFKKTNQPYIPFLRISLVLISLKEVWSIYQKQEGYFKLGTYFYQHDLVTQVMFPLFERYHEWLVVITLISGLMAMLGLFCRLSLAVYWFFCFLFYYLENSMGIYNHEAGLTIQILAVLAISPGLKNWSLDRLFIKHRTQSGSQNLDYSRWGVQLILVLIVLGYFTAGVSKIRYGGVQWMDGETLGYYMSGRASFMNDVTQKFIVADQTDWKESNSLKSYTYGNFQSNDNLIEFSRITSESSLLTSFLSISTVIFELGAIFILFSSKVRNVVLIAAIFFHFSIRLFMGLGFLDYQLICASLINWPVLQQQILQVFNGFKRG